LMQFQYLDQGIRVDKQFYPIVKMQWAEGDLLPVYIEKNLHDPHVLRKLLFNWRELIVELAAANIAHGDLQNGNILVDGENLRLVDYDGMYVPALLGTAPDEIGHRDFQHPQRSRADYNSKIDHFSALVIYLSIAALATTPQLWNDFHSEENLVFREDDFAKPGQTRLWQELLASPSSEVRRLTKDLETFCAIPLRDLPPLETVRSGTWKLASPALPGATQGVNSGIPVGNIPARESPSLPGGPPAASSVPPAAPAPAKRRRPAYLPYIYLLLGLLPYIVGMGLAIAGIVWFGYAVRGFLSSELPTATSTVANNAEDPTSVPSATPVPTPRAAATPNAETISRELLDDFIVIRAESYRTVSFEQLSTVLRGDALTDFKSKIEKMKADNCYWEFTDTHTDIISSRFTGARTIVVSLNVTEEATKFCNGDAVAHIPSIKFGMMATLEKINSHWYIYSIPSPSLTPD
jgi:hypothetical protein